MKRLNKFFSAVLCTMVLMGLSTSAYAKTILYVPQDDRPVDYAYTVKTAEDAGYTVREQDICDKEIKNKKELCYNASDQTNKITGDPSYETYYNRRTETS